MVSALPFFSPEFLDAFTIIVREGLEAILIIAAIIAYLESSGHKEKVKTVYSWSAAAIIASLFTAFFLEGVFAASEAGKEFLEGITMLLAAAVLLYVTNWLLGKIESGRWVAYIKGKVEGALTSRNTLALGIASFLAVYREGFETVLFFKALALGSADPSGIFAGLLLGLAVLVLLFIAIIRLEKRLPLKIVFGATSAILFILAFKFAGKGIHELQEAHALPETAFTLIPAIKDLGIYQTLETAFVQLLVLLSGAVLLYLHFFAGKKPVKKS